MNLIFSNEDDATNWALNWLRERAFVIVDPSGEQGLVPGELRHRFAPHLTSPGLTFRLQHRNCPPFRAEKSPNGRLLKIFPNPALLAFLAEPAKPGRRL